MGKEHGPRPPFDEGMRSLVAGGPQTNPFDVGSVAHRNFELGRAYAIRYREKAAQMWTRQPR